MPMELMHILCIMKAAYLVHTAYYYYLQVFIRMEMPMILKEQMNCFINKGLPQDCS